MFKISVINKSSALITNQATFETEQECLDWFNSLAPKGVFGKPEYAEKILVSEASEAIYEDQEIEIPAVIDEVTGEEIEPARVEVQSVLIQEAVEAVYETIEHPADFTWVIEDKTEEVEAIKQIADAKAYLSSTDYMAIREFEGGEPMPIDIKTQRAEKRVLINSLETQFDL